MQSDDLLLEIRGLKTYFFLDQGLVRAVDGVDLNVPRGQTIGIVGESGCGKSITARSVLQIVDTPGRVVEGNIIYRRTEPGDASDAASFVEEIDLAKLKPTGNAMRAIRGKEISMIFQEPMTSLSAFYTVGNQIMENITLHEKMTKQEARERTIELLHQVGIAKPEQRVDEYPHQFSGGMRQRAVIAMPSCCCMFHSSLRICAWVVTSSAVVGSSAMRRLGLQAIAMAITARWRMPPENWCGYSSTRCSGLAMPT